MKVGDRQQQGRTGDKREVCPACKKHYLRPSFSYDTIEGSETRKWIKVSMYCPNELCTYCRKE